MSEHIKVVIVDDDAAMYDTISRCLAREKDILLIHSFSSGEELLAGLPETNADVVLMDINMEGMTGIECVRQLKAHTSKLQVIMLTVFDDSESIFEALAAGADGYLLKTSIARRLVAAIRDVQTGGAPMSSSIARLVVKSFEKDKSKDKSDPKLSPRESDVLGALVRGLVYKQIADELNMSMGTLRTHICSIYKKLQVHSRTEAVVKYLEKSGKRR